MKTFLDRVREEKEWEIAEVRKLKAENELRIEAASLPKALSFAESLRNSPSGRPAVIAEVKPKAPGRRNIETLDLKRLIASYEAGGAAAVSVLTDGLHFGGSLDNLAEISQLTRLPILQKEFIVHPYQLLQGRIAGASAALLLSYYFTESELNSMIEHCVLIGLEPVVECSLEEEIPKTLRVNPKILLLNNRPIAAIPENPSATYMLGSVHKAREFWETFPELREWKSQPDRVLVSASCIDSREDYKSVAELPFDAVLVGNAVSQAEDPAEFLRQLQD